MRNIVMKTHPPLISHITKPKNNKNPNRLLINFESEEHVRQLLYRLSVVDVMKINNLNRDNEVVQSFLRSVFN